MLKSTSDYNFQIFHMFLTFKRSRGMSFYIDLGNGDQFKINLHSKLNPH